MLGYKPTFTGIVAVIVIIILLLCAGYIEVNAMPSLEEQRRQRELNQAYQHEMDLAELEAQTRRYEAKRYSKQRRYIIYNNGRRGGGYTYRNSPPSTTTYFPKTQKKAPQKRIRRAN